MKGVFCGCSCCLGSVSRGVWKEKRGCERILVCSRGSDQSSSQVATDLEAESAGTHGHDIDPSIFQHQFRSIEKHPGKNIISQCLVQRLLEFPLNVSSTLQC